MPAPSKFNLDIATAIVRHARMGRFRNAAAALVGISERTLKAWVQRGQQNLAALDAGTVEGYDEFGLFVKELLQAEAEARSACEGTIYKAALQGDVKAAALWLKHKCPADWGTNRVEVTGKDGAPIFEGSRDELRARIEERVRAATQSPGPAGETARKVH